MSLDNGYWERLKDYYENDYSGILPNNNTEDNVMEMNDSGATIYVMGDDVFNADVVSQWIQDTKDNLSQNEIEEYFPNIYDYDDPDEIASWYMWDDIDRFKDEIKKGNNDFVDEAVRLNWMEMLEEIPDVKDIFLF